ncbi:hypothetical protein N0V88_007700 [Collariella sp. IMI 366227]|nr:hypothetical protein N0V88_007700 [Collariella sp. IMI 366227]
MSQYYGAPPNQGYAPPPAPRTSTSYGYGGPSTGGYGDASSFSAGYGEPAGVSGRMGEQGGLRTGWLAAFSTEGYPGEPPLLQELGINAGHIQKKTLAVLNPFSRIDQHLMDDSDLAGPLLFFLLYGTFLLLSGRVHFGYIYGLAVFGSITLHMILSLMAPATIPDASPSSSSTTTNPASYPGPPPTPPTRPPQPWAPPAAATFRARPVI